MCNKQENLQKKENTEKIGKYRRLLWIFYIDYLIINYKNPVWIEETQNTIL